MSQTEDIIFAPSNLTDLLFYLKVPWCVTRKCRCLLTFFCLHSHIKQIPEILLLTALSKLSAIFIPGSGTVTCLHHCKSPCVRSWLLFPTHSLCSIQKDLCKKQVCLVHSLA
jgi:hypothetical protein